jgi:hypothetical protein
MTSQTVGGLPALTLQTLADVNPDAIAHYFRAAVNLVESLGAQAEAPALDTTVHLYSPCMCSSY